MTTIGKMNIMRYTEIFTLLAALLAAGCTDFEERRVPGDNLPEGTPVKARVSLAVAPELDEQGRAIPLTRAFDELTGPEEEAIRNVWVFQFAEPETAGDEDSRLLLHSTYIGEDKLTAAASTQEVEVDLIDSEGETNLLVFVANVNDGGYGWKMTPGFNTLGDLKTCNYTLRNNVKEDSRLWGDDWRNLIMSGSTETVVTEGVAVPGVSLERSLAKICLELTLDNPDYKIFSVFITNAYENQGEVWNYHDYADFKNADEENAYLNELSRRSLIDTGVDVRRGDKLLTLSTCTYEFKDARLVVVARAVRRGEDAAVDVSAASENPYPLMPDVWYRTFGGEKPDDAMLMQLSPASLISLSEAEEASEAARKKREAEEKAASEASARAASEASSKAESDAALKAASEAAAKAASEAAVKAASEAAEKAASEAAEKAASEAAEKAASEAAEKEEQERLLREEQERLEQEEQDRLAREEQERIEQEEQERIERQASEAAQDRDDEETRRGSEVAAIRVASYGWAETEEEVLDVVSRIVQNEVGSTFDEEAIKAQAVAAYTFIRQANSAGGTPTVAMAGSVSNKVREAVWDVLGETVYYRDAVAFTPYHAMSCGSTTSSRYVWGGSYPYLNGVDSEVDERAQYFEVDTVMKASKVEELIESRLGITVEGDPEDWFEILTENDGYNGEMSVCGETRSRRTGSTLTGRLIRETVLNLRSASFEIDYDYDRDSFTFTTYGYGHGVGLSQHGANFLAADGWDYVEILEQYFPGTEVY